MTVTHCLVYEFFRSITTTNIVFVFCVRKLESFGNKMNWNLEDTSQGSRKKRPVLHPPSRAPQRTTEYVQVVGCGW